MSFANANPRRRSAATGPAAETEKRNSSKLNMSLRKGATFHSSSATSSKDDFVPPSLPRTQTHMDDVTDANQRRSDLTFQDLEKSISDLEALSLFCYSDTKSSGTVVLPRDNGSPIPRGFLDIARGEPETPETQGRQILRPHSVRPSRTHASDSGIGSSVASNKNKLATAGSEDRNTSPSGVAAITRTMTPSTAEKLPALSNKAINRIHEHTLGPLLESANLKDFASIVIDVPRRIQSKEIICLRDLEKTLLFQAPERSKTPEIYLDFCLTSIRCIQATVEYLSDREQVRPNDRPYTNGYFIDLKEQIFQYGRQLAAVKQNGIDETDADYDQSDEIKLYGGIAENGRQAELVRMKKDGTAISLATGKPVDMGDGPIHIKRSLSEEREDEEEIMRSMARRKKNASPEELAPKRCREPGCHKEFKRPCDLTKHEKTHVRPWKCPFPTCVFNRKGWPTEKEMDRHINDKHSDAPAMYECKFENCPYKSKRESNCKQHMEKAHGWTYVRTKTNGKKGSSRPDTSVLHTPPPLGDVSTPSTTPAYSVPTPPQDEGGSMVSTDFPAYMPDADWIAAYGLGPESLTTGDLSMENLSPASTAVFDQMAPYQNGSTFIINDEDLYAAHVQLPAQMQTANMMSMYKMMPHQQVQPQQQPMVQQQPVPMMPSHFSPTGQQNAMLYTPTSLQEMDDTFDESISPGDGVDFPLFPVTITKSMPNQSLFAEYPSANMGFTQMSQQDIYQQPMDWTNMEYQHGYQE